MKIVFNKIYIHNFLSIGDAEISLKDLGYVIVSGENRNPTDKTNSNGAGKSTIFEAISYALTGETIRGTKNVVNTKSDGGMEIGLWFDIDNSTYEIHRYREHKQYGTSLQIIINGEDKSGKGIRESEKILATLLPDVTAQLVGSVILIGQGMPQRFSNNTPSGRKELLEKLTKSDFMIEDLKAKLANRKSELSVLERQLDDEILKLETTKRLKETAIQQSITKKQSLIDTPIPNSIDIESSLNSLRLQQAELKTKLETLSTNGQSIHQQLDTLTQEKLDRVMAIRDDLSAALSPLQQEQQSLSAQILALQSEIKRINSIVDICPTCKRKYDGVVKPSTEAQRNQIALLQPQLEQVENNIANVRKDYANKERNTTISYDKEREMLMAQEKTLSNSIAEIKMSLQSVTTKIERQQMTLATITAQQQSIKKQIEDIERAIDGGNQEVAEITNTLSTKNDERINVKTRLSVVSKMITIATRDFRGYLLGNIIVYINSRLKQYSSYLFGSPIVEMKIDGNSINILYDDRQYENLSGGERHKVDIIIQLAIRDMLCEFTSFSCNIIALDEVFDNLDTQSCQSIINLFSNSLVDIESIFIITHHSDIEIPYDTQLKVIKDESGVSSVCQV